MLSTFNKVDKVNCTDTEYERLSDACKGDAARE